MTTLIDVSKWRARPSELGRIISAYKFGISDAKDKELDKLYSKIKSKKKLTPLQKDTYYDLLSAKYGAARFTDGGLTFAREKALELVFNRRKKFHNKFVEKGNEKEDEAIRIFNGLSGTDYKKNTRKFVNEYLEGTPDIYADYFLGDIKNSWDIFTFPFFQDKLPTSGYRWQLKGYALLLSDAGIKVGKQAHVIYVLTSATEDLINDEIFRVARQRRVIDAEAHGIDKEVRHDLIFDDIPIDKRVKIYDIDIDLKKDRGIIKPAVEAMRVLIEKNVKKLIEN